MFLDRLFFDVFDRPYKAEFLRRPFLLDMNNILLAF